MWASKWKGYVEECLAHNLLTMILFIMFYTCNYTANTDLWLLGVHKALQILPSWQMSSGWEVMDGPVGIGMSCTQKQPYSHQNLLSMADN